MPRKRANRTGSVYKNRSRNRWEAVVVVGHHEDGRPIRRTLTAPTRDKVEQRLREARDALDAGMAIPDATTTIEDFARLWRAHILSAEGLAPKTERWYREMLAYYVLPHVGQRTLTGPRAVTVGDVEQLTGQLARQHSPRTAEGARTTLGKMLRAAERRGLVSRNVVRLAAPVRDSGRVRNNKALTAHQVAQLLDALDGTRWHPVALVGVTTGLRPGELLGLCWPEVHLDATHPHVSVQRSLSYVPGYGRTLKAPKRPRSYRTVPLVPEAVSALRLWRKTQAGERLAAGELWTSEWPNLTFTTPAGAPVWLSAYQRALGDALADAYPYRLRHTYATHLLEAGTPIHHVAELLGDTVMIVERSYSHVLRAKHETVDVTRGLVGGAQ